MSRALLISCCCFTILCASCGPHRERRVTTCFYHWKTKVALTAEDSAMLKGTGCKKLYVNFFDVVPNQDTFTFKYPAVPGSQTQNFGGLPKNMEIVPVVYVTNEAIKQMDSASIPLMADKICGKVSRFINRNRLQQIKELQMDCDWTNGTRDRYFYLLSLIKERSHVPVLSATIRLFQYKYFRQTGVPPVDRGVLMFYHMNAIRDMDSKDLILDVEEGKKYMTGPPYPLRLDYALPLFSEMLVKIADEIRFYSPKTLARLLAGHTLEKIDSTKNKYKVIGYASLDGHPLWNGNIVKIESTDVQELKRAADLLSIYANSDTFNVIFFHLDRDANSAFNAYEVKNIVSRFD